jgi:cytochrome P450 family 313
MILRFFTTQAQDTTALSISSALLFIAMHKNVQDKLVAELKSVFGVNPNVSLADLKALSNLNYLEMVINETLRLLPVVPFVFRFAEKEIQLQNYKIPAGANILIPIFRIQRNKAYWGEDANEFRPERFEREDFKNIHPYAYVPFTSEC